MIEAVIWHSSNTGVVGSCTRLQSWLPHWSPFIIRAGKS